MQTTLRSARLAAGMALGVIVAIGANAASHREAPMTALDRTADITDFFAFVSYDDPSKVTMIMNVDPLLEPSNGPNYFPFDPEITYTLNVDNDFDARRDVSFEFRFKTEVRLPNVFTGFVGFRQGLAAPQNSPAPVTPGTIIVPTAITALDADTDNDDLAGFPNGRRVSDDVTDIVARVAAGVFAGPEFNRFPHNRIGDGVNANDVDYPEIFPYLGLAHSGRDRQHVDPGEPGCVSGVCPVD